MQIRRRRATAKEKPPIFEMTITLDGVHPPVWRRFRVDPLCTLPLLHLIIQAVMGWNDTHAHRFEANGIGYGPRDPDWPDVDRDERRYRLLSLVKQAGESFRYAYDLGDDWRHTVVLERTLERSRSVVHPKCVEGENACPPEDVGGPRGYRKLLMVLADPTSRQYAEMRDWVGPRFDPGRFDVRYQNLPMWDLRGTTPYR